MLQVVVPQVLQVEAPQLTLVTLLHPGVQLTWSAQQPVSMMTATDKNSGAIYRFISLPCSNGLYA